MLNKTVSAKHVLVKGVLRSLMDNRLLKNKIQDTNPLTNLRTSETREQDPALDTGYRRSLKVQDLVMAFQASLLHQDGRQADVEKYTEAAKNVGSMLLRGAKRVEGQRTCGLFINAQFGQHSCVCGIH